MKILMLISSLDIGGAETHVCELSAALTAQGHRVCVVSRGGELVERIEAVGAEHIRLPLDSRSPLKLIRAYVGLLAILRRWRFDVLHAHSRIAAYVGEKVARRCGVCFVTTAHARFKVTPIKKYMSKWGYYVSAVSEDIAEYLRTRYGIERERISVIPNGIDTACFFPKETKRSADESGLRVIFASRLDSDCSRGAYSLCRCASDIAKRYRGITFDIAGGGSEYENLRRLADRMNGQIGYQCIRVLGAVRDMAALLRAGDLFVGVSRAALEAMSCGVCVVLAGDEGFFGGLNEENIDSAAKTNFCARGYPMISDGKMLSEVISALDMGEERRRARGKKLRKYVRDHHSIETSALSTAAFYRMALREFNCGTGDVCLCGYYGYGNTGDDTLLRGAIIRAREEYGDRIAALSRCPRTDRYHYGVVCVSAKNPFTVYRQIISARCVAFGGGTIFQDGTSLRSLLYYALLAIIAKRHGSRVELWANGLGPIKSSLGKRITSRVLKLCDHLGFRDGRSAEFAVELGADKHKIVIEKDLAFYLERSKKTAGSGVRNGRYAVFSASGRATVEEKEILQSRAIRARQGGIMPIFVGMYPAQDKKISLRMCEAVGGDYIDGLCGKELIELLRGASFGCGHRYHLLVFSKIAGIPFEGIGSDPKIRAFCEEQGGRYLERIR